MSELLTCDYCGEVFPTDELVCLDGQHLCPDCLEEHTCVCERCGQRIWADDEYGDEHHTLCESCCERYYETCAGCGRLVEISQLYFLSDDDAEGYCCHCHDRYVHEHGIQTYYYKPTPIFYGGGNRYFGVELEIDGGGERNDYANRLLAAANDENEHIYIKHDGSLNDGMEIVTHPMTLDYHLTQMPWNNVIFQAISLGYRSHQARTCGLHVHVNRTAFGESEAMQDACIARMLYFFEKHWGELLKFSRRTPQQLERWASRYGYKDRPRDILDHAKKGRQGRYTCVNLENRDTVEFRMFRGTLKYNTLIATLQLVNRVCDVAFFLSDEEVQGLSWTSFVAEVTEPELIQYLKERRLYVNEPVDTEVEL